MVSRYSTFIKAINLTFDYTVLNISLVAAYLIENKIHTVWPNSRSIPPIVLVFNLIWLLSANITGLYANVLNTDSIRTFRNVIKTYLLFISLMCTIIIMVGSEASFITRGYLFYSSVLFGFLLWLWKVIFLSIRKSGRTLLFESRNVVVVGFGKTGKELCDFFDHNPDRGYKLAGFFDDDADSVKGNPLYIGPTANCVNFLLTHEIDEIFCTLKISETNKIHQLLVYADKHLIRFKFVPEYYDYGIKELLIESFGHIPIISVRPEPQESILNRFFKRAFDTLFSLFVIVFILSWVFPILAILITLGSKGPVFFKQLRSGRDNQPFMCYKFRSMRLNSEADNKQATPSDRRVTKIGAFMRRTSIDELPQFFNVLIGNMSTVGPRPHMLNHTKQYAQLIDRYMVRHFLKPGITGWAQVQGLRGETRTTESMQKRVESDVWYLENWSFLLDLKIIFLTIWNSVKGDENAF
jgi:putative colanic acid biosynthesis UDP-glucose lipid carrier transferase